MKLIEEAKKCVILCANCHRETEEQLSHLGEAGAHAPLKTVKILGSIPRGGIKIELTVNLM
jgi:hypothetical protein